MILTDYKKRKEGGRQLSNVENSVNAAIQELVDYIKKSK